MNLHPLVSIIVPVYNVEAFLDACIQSIRQQTYKHMQIILVDDGSTDNSGSICDSISALDNRFVVIHQDNAGLSGARNTGLEHANGEYIMFVDSDDVIHPEAVAYMVSLAQQYDASCVTAQCFLFHWNEHPVYQKLTVQHEVLHNHECLEYVLMDKTHIGVTAKLFSRLAFGNIRFALGEINEDLIPTTFFMADQERIVAAEAPLYGYRRSRLGSITGSIYKKEKLCVLKHLDDMYNMVKHRYPELIRAADYLCLITAQDMANNAGSYYFSSSEARFGYRLFRQCFLNHFYCGFFRESCSVMRCGKALSLLIPFIGPLFFTLNRVFRNG